MKAFLSIVSIFVTIRFALAGGVTGDELCDNFLQGIVPPGFPGAPATPVVDLNRLEVRECVDQENDFICRNAENRKLGTPVTAYKLNTKYIINFDSGNLPYTNFTLSDSSGFFIDVNSYNDVEINKVFNEGGCFEHGFTTSGGVFINNTDLTWEAIVPSESLANNEVQFKVLVKIDGSDFYYQKNLSFVTPDCPGFDEAQNILSCSARYNGETCTPLCTPGYQGAGDISCTGGAYDVSSGACQTPIDPFCDQPDEGAFQYSLCPDKTVDANCTEFCDPDDYEEVGTLTCDTDQEWTGGSCNYIGNCPLSDLLDQPNVAIPSPTDPTGCRNAPADFTCIYTCDVGYEATSNSGNVTCTLTGWNPDPVSCDPIPAFCDINSITGVGVNAGECTTRDITDQSTCLYGCDQPGYIPKNAQLQCTGGTQIGWNIDTFECETPFPTQAPVPTIIPTNFPVPTPPTAPTASPVPTPPTVPSPPTLNPFFQNQPTEPSLTNEPIFIILSAGGGAIVLAVAVVVGLQFRGRRTEGGEVVINEKGEVENEGQIEAFGKLEKLEYNAFDNW